MKVEYHVIDAVTGNPITAKIREATQFDYQKTAKEQWQTSWLSDFIQAQSLEKYALEIAATGELVGLGAYRDMPEGVLVYVEYIEVHPIAIPLWLPGANIKVSVQRCWPTVFSCRSTTDTAERFI